VAVEINRREGRQLRYRQDRGRIGVEFKGAPEGYVRIHENHHLWSKTRVGKAKLDGQYELVYETADLVEPDPFPKGYQ
jgi:urea transport system substrate-binding protein